MLTLSHTKVPGVRDRLCVSTRREANPPVDFMLLTSAAGLA